MRSAPISSMAFEQGLGVEIARRGDIEIFAEIVADRFLRRIFVAVVDPAIGVVDPPQRVRQVLAQMAENDLQPRMGVEQAGAHQPQRMHRGLLRERPDRPEQPGMAVVDLRVARQRIARMQIERHVEPLHRRPERPVLRQVVIDRGVVVVDLRKAVDQRAAETEFLHAALELAGRARRDPASPARQGPESGPAACCTCSAR